MKWLHVIISSLCLSAAFGACYDQIGLDLDAHNDASAEDEICLNSDCTSSPQKLIDTCQEYCDTLALTGYSVVVGTVNNYYDKSYAAEACPNVLSESIFSSCAQDHLENLNDVINSLLQDDTGENIVSSVLAQRKAAQAISERANTVIGSEIKDIMDDSISSTTDTIFNSIKSAVADNKPDVGTQVDELKTLYEMLETNMETAVKDMQNISSGLLGQLATCVDDATTKIKSMCGNNADDVSGTGERVWCCCRATPIASLPLDTAVIGACAYVSSSPRVLPGTLPLAFMAGLAAMMALWQ